MLFARRTHLLLGVIYLADIAVVKELRWFCLLRFRNGLGQEIENSLNTGLRSNQLAPKAGALIEFVGAVEKFRIGFSGVFRKHFHSKALVAVIAIDASSYGTQERNEPSTEFVHAAESDD